MKINLQYMRSAMRFAGLILAFLLIMSFFTSPAVSGETNQSEITMATAPASDAGAPAKPKTVSGFELSASGLSYIIPGRLSLGIVCKEMSEDDDENYLEPPDMNGDDFRALFNIEIKF